MSGGRRWGTFMSKTRASRREPKVCQWILRKAILTYAGSGQKFLAYVYWSKNACNAKKLTIWKCPNLRGSLCSADISMKIACSQPSQPFQSGANVMNVGHTRPSLRCSMPHSIYADANSHNTPQSRRWTLGQQTVLRLQIRELCKEVACQARNVFA